MHHIDCVHGEHRLNQVESKPRSHTGTNDYHVTLKSSAKNINSAQSFVTGDCISSDCVHL